MQAKLSKAFDECLARKKRGEAVKAYCLAEYRHLLQQLVPLLHTALFIGTVPKVSASDEFKKLSKARLMARLQKRSIQAEKSSSGLSVAWRGLERAITGPGKVAIPLTLALIVVLQGLFLFGVLNFSSPAATPALASHCTLTTLDGSVQLKSPGSSTWEEAGDGMTLEAGSRVKTAPNSQALLTFFNGTTVKLEPGTDLVVEQVEGNDENQPTVIVLKQWLGKTWNRVVKLADPGSHYEIQTPSTHVLVRGTFFATEVDETGATTVQTIEGLVSVSAQGKEVYLPAGQQTAVEPGAPPTKPMPIGPIAGEGPTGQGQEEPPEKAAVEQASVERAEPFETTEQDTEDERLPEQNEEESPARSLDSEGPPAQGQGGPPVQGQDDGQGKSTGTGEGQDTEQGSDYMLWMVLGVALFSLGLTVFMWRRQ